MTTSPSSAVDEDVLDRLVAHVRKLEADPVFMEQERWEAFCDHE